MTEPQSSKLSESFWLKYARQMHEYANLMTQLEGYRCELEKSRPDTLPVLELAWRALAQTVEAVSIQLEAINGILPSARDVLEGRGPTLEGRTWVVVNLNLDTVRQQNQLFDEERILKVLERIAGDLDAWGRGQDVDLPSDEALLCRYDLAAPPPPTEEERLEEIRAHYRTPKPTLR